MMLCYKCDECKVDGTKKKIVSYRLVELINYTESRVKKMDLCDDCVNKITIKDFLKKGRRI